MKMMRNDSSENELHSFFDELKEFYLKGNHDFVWEWEKVIGNPHEEEIVRDFVYYMAYNLGKNVIHGQLPAHLHARMVFNKNNWSRKYIEYLEGK